MSRLNFFMKLYSMYYIKDVVIPETNKRLKLDMNLSEYFCVISCNLIMACYVGHSVRDFFLKDPITPHKCAPILLNHSISRRHLEKITQVKFCTNLAIPEFNYTFSKQRQMQEGRNKNTEAHFDPSWVSFLDDSTQEWINRYTWPGWMFAPHKPHPFVKQCHTIVCDKSKVVYIVDIMEGKDQPIVVVKKEFEEKGAMSGLIMRMTETLCVTVKVVAMDSGFCVPEGLI